jgi:hypothetical protein
MLRRWVRLPLSDYGARMIKAGQIRYEFVGDYKEPLTAAFEIDGKSFVTDRSTLDLLNYEFEQGSFRVAEWVFAVNLATGRIKRTH